MVWKKKSSRVKKHHSTLEMDTYKVMLLLFSLNSIKNLAHELKSPFLDIETTISARSVYVRNTCIINTYPKIKE